MAVEKKQHQHDACLEGFIIGLEQQVKSQLDRLPADMLDRFVREELLQAEAAPEDSGCASRKHTAAALGCLGAALGNLCKGQKQPSEPGAERASSSAGKRPEEDNESAAKEQERAAQESDVPFESRRFPKRQRQLSDLAG